MLSSAVPGAGAPVAGGGAVLLRLPLRAVPQVARRDEGQLPAGHLPGPARPHPLLHDQVATVRTEHWFQVSFRDRYVSKRQALKHRFPVAVTCTSKMRLKEVLRRENEGLKVYPVDRS